MLNLNSCRLIFKKRKEKKKYSEKTCYCKNKNKIIDYNCIHPIIMPVALNHLFNVIKLNVNTFQ